MSAVVGVVLLVTCAVPVASYNVHDSLGKRWDVIRTKRDSTNKRGFSLAEQQELLDIHNKYRSEEQATDMRMMEWDHDLARIAQSWADRCVWTHSQKSNRQHPAFRYTGENLYAKTADPTPLEVVKDWADEKMYYNYNNGMCSKVCGHYTQVVWANSYALGCGVRFCSSIQNLNWEEYGGGYVVVCNYGPGGNYIGEKPFTLGRSACSDCSEEFPYCIQGLCSKTKDTTPISSSETLHQHSTRHVVILMLFYFWLSR